MTTDPLQERIARALNDEGWTFEGVHEPGDYDECEDCRSAVDPIAARVAEEVAAEVRKAQADAWDEGWEQGMAYVVGMERGTDDDHAITNPYKASEGA